MKDTLMVIGEALIDFTPTETRGIIERCLRFYQALRRAPINIAAAAAKLGAHSKVLTQVGADAFWRFLS